MRAWSFAAVGVIVIQSVLMMAYTTYADTSSSSRFRLRDSFSVVGDGQGGSQTYRVRDRGGESAPHRFITRTLQTVAQTVSSTGSAVRRLALRAYYESLDVSDTAARAPQALLQPGVPPATPPQTETAKGPVAVPVIAPEPAPTPAPQQSEALERSIEALGNAAKPMIQPIQEFVARPTKQVPSIAPREGSTPDTLLYRRQPPPATEGGTGSEGVVPSGHRAAPEPQPESSPTVAPIAEAGKNPTPAIVEDMKQRVEAVIVHSVAEKGQTISHAVVERVRSGAESVKNAGQAFGNAVIDTSARIQQAGSSIIETIRSFFKHVWKKIISSAEVIRVWAKSAWLPLHTFARENVVNIQPIVSMPTGVPQLQERSWIDRRHQSAEQWQQWSKSMEYHYQQARLIVEDALSQAQQQWTQH